MISYLEILQLTLSAPEDSELLKAFMLLIEASQKETVPVKICIIGTEEDAHNMGYHGHTKRKELNQAIINQSGLSDPQTDEEFDSWAKLFFFECANGEPGEVLLYFGPSNCKSYTEINL
ncbi:MAG: hypothetical protein WCO65_02675 [bacterium]